MKKLFWALEIAVLFLSVIPVKAMETIIYTGTTTGTNTPNIFVFTTLRTGDVTAHATFPFSNHGIYYLGLDEDLGGGFFRHVCGQTLDARWGRAVSGDMTCFGSAQPVGNYQVSFQSNRKVYFSVEVVAETNP